MTCVTTGGNLGFAIYAYTAPFSLLLKSYFIGSQASSTKNLNYRIKAKMVNLKIAICFFFSLFSFTSFSYALVQLNLQYKAGKSVLGTRLQ